MEIDIKRGRWVWRMILREEKRKIGMEIDIKRGKEEDRYGD